MQNFREKVIREIRWWAWAAAVLPIASLATLFFIWAFGTDHLINVAMISGASSLFTIAVVWWWWALQAIRNLIDNWNITKENVIEVLEEVKQVKTLVNDVISVQSDK